MLSSCHERSTKPWVWCVGKFCKYQGVNLGSGGGIRKSRYIRIALLIVIVPSIIATYVPKLTIPFLAYGKLVRSPLLVRIISNCIQHYKVVNGSMISNSPEHLPPIASGHTLLLHHTVPSFSPLMITAGGNPLSCSTEA